MMSPEVESSKTHFEVLGLGLEGQVLCLGLKSSKIDLSLAQGLHYFLECSNFVDRLKNFLQMFFFFEIARKKFFEDLFFRRTPTNFFEDPFFFFGEHLRQCPRSLASSIPVLGLKRVCPPKSCPWPWPRIFLYFWPWPPAFCP